MGGGGQSAPANLFGVPNKPVLEAMLETMGKMCFQQVPAKCGILPFIFIL